MCLHFASFCAALGVPPPTAAAEFTLTAADGKSIFAISIAAARNCGTLRDAMDHSGARSFSIPFPREIVLRAVPLISRLALDINFNLDAEYVLGQWPLVDGAHARLETALAMLALNQLLALVPCILYLEQSAVQERICVEIAQRLASYATLAEARAALSIVADLTTEEEAAAMREPLFTSPNHGLSAAAPSAIQPCVPARQPSATTEDAFEVCLQHCSAPTLCRLKGLSESWRERARSILCSAAWRARQARPTTRQGTVRVLEVGWLLTEGDERWEELLALLADSPDLHGLTYLDAGIDLNDLFAARRIGWEALQKSMRGPVLPNGNAAPVGAQSFDVLTSGGDTRSFGSHLGLPSPFLAAAPAARRLAGAALLYSILKSITLEEVLLTERAPANQFGWVDDAADKWDWQRNAFAACKLPIGFWSCVCPALFAAPASALTWLLLDNGPFERWALGDTCFPIAAQSLRQAAPLAFGYREWSCLSPVGALVIAISRGLDARIDLPTGFMNETRTTTAGMAALQKACEHGHIGVARAMLQAGVDPNTRTSHDSWSLTPLMIASDLQNTHLVKARGKARVARALVEAGADVNALTGRGQSALARALGGRDKSFYLGDRAAGPAEEKTEAIAHSNSEGSEGGDADWDDGERRQPVALLLESGAWELDESRDTVRACIDQYLHVHPDSALNGFVGFERPQRGAGPADSTGESGPRSPLVLAAESGDVAAVEDLLGRKAFEIDERDCGGMTALMAACINGHVEVVRVLLRLGANTALRVRGWAALALASRAGHAEVAAALLEAGALLEGSDDHGTQTALMEACESGHEDVARVLIAAGADMNYGDDYSGLTPLILASARGLAPVVAALLEAGAHVHAQPGEFGDTALMAAARAGQESIVATLLEAGAAVDAAVPSFGEVRARATAHRTQDCCITLSTPFALLCMH